MKSKWTNEEINNILVQLDEKCLPFSKYTFVKDGADFCCIGEGSTALVYEAVKRKKFSHKRYAIKVVGFNDGDGDSELFVQSTQAQMNLSITMDNIANIADYAEFFVWIEDDRVSDIKRIYNHERPTDNNCIKLQFILMEKLEPLIKRDGPGNVSLSNYKLIDGGDKERYKLAYDVAKGLNYAHSKNILHRDIKLENIMYSYDSDCYKIVDFGIAKITRDGSASTIAFTKGYGAPEVVYSKDDKYDKTADIYSLGILLYVLFNDLKFPDSKNYNVNLKSQYQEGYVLPQPENCSDEMYRIIKKMCQYDPDDRYQSMDEVMNEIEALLITDELKYKRTHQKGVVTLSVCFSVLGIVLWKFCFIPEYDIKLTPLVYVFMAMGVVKFVLYLYKKNTVVVSILMVALGTYLLVSTGFEWWKLLILMAFVFFKGRVSGIGAGVLILLKLLAVVEPYYSGLTVFLNEERWIVILVLSIAYFLLCQYIAMDWRDVKMLSHFHTKNTLFLIVFITYLMCCLLGIGLCFIDINMFNVASGVYSELKTYELLKVGITGLIFWGAFFIREKILMNKS